MTRSGWLRAALLVFGLLVLGLLVLHFGLQGVATALANLDPWRFAAYLVLAAAVRLGYSTRWMLLNRAVGVQLPLWRVLAMRVAGDAASSIIPAGRVGGDPLRVLLVRRTGVTGVDASASVALDRFLEITGNTAAVLAYLAVYSTTRALPHAPAMIVTFTVLLAVLIGTGVLLRRGARPFSFPLQVLGRTSIRIERLRNAVRRTEDRLTRFFRDSPRVFAIAMLITLATEALVVLEYYVLLSAFGLPVSLPLIVMVLLGGGLARAVPTPAGLGALEASGVAMVGLVSGRPDLGFVVGLVLRLDDTLWTVIGLVSLAGLGAPFRGAVAPSANLS